MDWMITIIGCASFVFFLIVQCIIFRCVKTEGVFKAIIKTYGIALVLNVIVSAIVLPKTWSMLVIGIILSAAIYTLMAFVYILCIFGPYETSIRMRLIREMAQHPGMTKEELLTRYNANLILDVRLKRLLMAGDIRQEQGKYILIKETNAFFLIETIAKYLGQWTAPYAKH